MNNHEKRHLNDIEALSWVHRFGWLRAIELGKLMKPHTATAVEAGARLARGLVKRRLVLSRKLPDGAGQALVLATAGVRLLADAGVSAVSGKDIGKATEQKNEQWIPSTSWKHDLIAHGVLCELHKHGYEVIPETEIRRMTCLPGKLPDGLARLGPAGPWLWLEVEHARKSGPQMRHLADAVCTVSGNAMNIAGMRPSTVLIAFARGARDERGYSINHRDRIRAAVGALTRCDVELTFAECTLRGAAGIGSVEFTKETVQSNRAAAILKKLDASGWYKHESGCTAANYAGNIALVWEDDPMGWSYIVEQPSGEAVGHAGQADNISEAKRAAASILASL